MSSFVARYATRRPRVGYAEPDEVADHQPRNPDCWLVPSVAAVRDSPAEAGLRLGDRAAADPHPLRRTASAPTTESDRLGDSGIPSGVLAALRRSTGNGVAPAAPIPADSLAPHTVLRRRISATSADIAAARGKKTGLAKLTGGKDGLDKIGKLLDRHASLTDQPEQIDSLVAIVALVDRWLRRHSGDKDQAVVRLLEDVNAEARRDLGQARAQQRYVNDLRAGELAGTRPRAAHEPTTTPLTQQLSFGMGSKVQGVMAQSKQQFGDQDPRKASADLIRSAGLTEAEVAAIKLFTSNDFLYLNPAVANSSGWMADQMGDIGKKAAYLREAGDPAMDAAKLHAEGVTHAGVMMQGLAKMEAKRGTVYRGARMSAAEFADRYGKRSQITYTSFVSSAVDKDPAYAYARGGGAVAPRPDQTVSVKCVFDVDDARDIRAISEVRSEEEWLLLPGSTFQITKIEDETDGEVGRPPATAWKVVHLKQTKGGSGGPGAGASGAPAGSAPDLSSPAAQALARLGRGDFSVPAARPPAPPAASPLQAMQRLGRRDFGVPAGRQQGHVPILAPRRGGTARRRPGPLGR